jgi:predicted RNase H-like HicB family nuclease
MGKYEKLFTTILSGRQNKRNRMNKYEIIVYWSSEDNAFVAEVPELAGCMSDGQSYVEAVQNAEIAIAEWIETAVLMNRAVPSARGKLIYA